MRRWSLTFLILFGAAILVAGCDDSRWGSTRLIVINNTADTVLVEVDEHEDGDIDVSATLGPGSQVSWVLDAGWAVVFVDGDGTEIFLDENYDGIFEIANQ
jgi:nitrogenase subunit NifH